MIFHPANLALVAASLLTATVIVAAAIFALRLVRHWDLASGAERQIRLERTTYLVSTAVAFVLVVEAVTLVLFAFTADRMAALFVGAMCAVGTLNASVYGFPTLWAKIAVFFAATVWLVIDHVDNRGRDYPLIRIKYLGILVLAPLILAEAGLQLAYFLDLKADTITSCCGRLFGETSTGTGGEMASMDPAHALILLFGGLAAIGFVGLTALRHRAARMLHGPASLAMFLAALAAVVSVIAPYVYEQPHHHCAFCILKPEYHHFGFALYLPLFLGTGAGLAAGVLAFLPRRASLAGVKDAIERRLVSASLLGFALFGAIAAWAIAGSGLTLFS
jgi:hypothetical protein